MVRNNTSRNWLSINESFLKEYVKSRNITQIFLEVRESNTLAQKLYEKNRFSESSCSKNYYKEPQEKMPFVMCAKLRKEAQ